MTSSFIYKIKIILILSGLVYSSNIFTQEKANSEELDIVIDSIFNAMNNKNFSSLMDLTYPELFDKMSKDEVLNSYIAVYKGNEYFNSEVKSLELKDANISKVYRDDNNNLDFAFMDYPLRMTITFSDNEKYNHLKNETIRRMKILGIFKGFLEDNKIEVYKTDNIIILLKGKSTSNKWTMIYYYPDSFFFSVLTNQVMEKAKDYYQVVMRR